MAIDPKSFLYEHDAATHVATVTLNRPERLNALTFEVYDELREVFEALDTEPGVRAIVLTGAGERAFCTGGDVNDIIGELFEPRLSRLARLHPSHRGVDPRHVALPPADPRRAQRPGGGRWRGHHCRL